MKLLVIIFLCSGLVALDGVPIEELYDNYYYFDLEEGVQNINLRQAQARRNLYQILCGTVVCSEMVEKLVTEPNIFIPNVDNVTCVECYNQNNQSMTPITKKRQVQVFEKLSFDRYRHISNRVVNDGCKCMSL